MADDLSPSERAAIDAAMAEGRVRRIGTGVFTAPVHSKTGGGQVGYRIVHPGQAIDDAPVIALSRSESMRRQWAFRQLAERRAAPLLDVYEALVAEGLTTHVMAERLDRSPGTVQNNCARFGLEPRREVRARQVRGGVSAALRALYVDMVARGLTVPEMAVELDRSVHTVRNNLHRMRLRAARDPNLGGNRRKVAA